MCRSLHLLSPLPGILDPLMLPCWILHILGFSPNVTSSERPLWLHNLNYSLFIASPNFLFFPTTYMLFNYISFLLFFFYICSLPIISCPRGREIYLFYSSLRAQPNQGLAYSKLPINSKQFLVTI